MKLKIDFVKEKTWKGLFEMFVPLMVAMVLNMAYNLVDSIWIGNLLGKQAMAALTSSTPIVLMLSSIGMGATNGLTILVSQAIGSKEQERLHSILTTSFIASLVLCILITGLGEWNLTQILKVLNTPKEIQGMAKSYLEVYLLGFLAVYLYLYFTAILRSYGNAMFQVAAILFCTVLNAILDPVFIHMMGFQGAAIATLLTQSLALVFMIIYIARKKLLSFDLRKFDVKIEKEILSKAIPAVIQQSIPALSTTVLTAIVSGFGVTAIAAYGITGKLETILFYPAMALNMALTTIIGQCIGAGRKDRVQDYLRTALISGGTALVILSLVVIGCSRNLTYLFLQQDQVSKIVAVYFMIVSVGYILNTVTNCYLGTINGAGKPMYGMFLMIFYYIVIRMPLAKVFSMSHLGLEGVWYAVLISHIVAAGSAMFLCHMILRNKEVTIMHKTNHFRNQN